jgi:ribosomal protein S18 acetylase RimI-like enzyme
VQCSRKRGNKGNFNKMEELQIREIKQDEIYFLSEMLYEAIFVPNGEKKLPKEIINEPELNNYIREFGRENDFCFVAEIDKKLIGAIWIRQFNENNKGYGFVNSETPELSMAINKSFRAKGIGKIMLDKMAQKLIEFNFSQVSLSVDKRNFAYDFYKKNNFIEIQTENNSIKMLKILKEES